VAPKIKNASASQASLNQGWRAFRNKLKFSGCLVSCFGRSARSGWPVRPAFVGGLWQRKVNASLVKFVLAPNGSINSDWLTVR